MFLASAAGYPDGGFPSAMRLGLLNNLVNLSPEERPWKSVIGIICLAVGAGLAYFFLAGKSNSKLKSANEQIESARGEAERITSEARRQADTAKKEAVPKGQGGDSAAQAELRGRGEEA